MALAAYRRKRDFAKTAEPKGRRPSKRRKSLNFVVQFHRARSAHYDFRLELDGVLRSWAVPKGPSTNPSNKRLAVEVEDHPLEYGSFEGTIPPGQYGAGTVKIWDKGTWEPDSDAAAGLRKGSLKFTLKGRKLKGRWALVRMKSGDRPGKANWLLIKEREPTAMARRAKAPSRARRTTIAPGRNGSTRAASPAPGARRAAQPERFAPQLCTLVESVPEGDQWRHEVKFDGYRALAFIERGRVRLLTRNGLDWTDRFTSIARDLETFQWRQGILDGEVVALNEHGTSDFQSLQAAIKGGGRLQYYLFDVPHWGGWDLTACALEDRQRVLEDLLAESESTSLKFSHHIDGRGQEVIGRACKLGLEGIVSKREGSPYTQARSRDWLKVRCSNRQELVIAGYTDPKNSREALGALLVGYHRDGEFVYAGKVGTGFDSDTLNSLGRQLKRLERHASPFSESPPTAIARSAHWVDPRLVAEIKFSEWTRDGRLRHPVFLGLRPDKKAAAIVRERPAVVSRRTPRLKPAPKRPSTVRRRSDDPEVAGVRITNSDRAVYAESGLTKLDVARYYERIADRILPHLQDRPISTVRCPQGAGGACFFNKHLDASNVPGLRSVDIRESKGVKPYLIVTDVRGLVYLAQMNVLELHTWGSRAADLERPDRLVFDLDPGEGTNWDDVRYAAERVRTVFDHIGLESYLKTTGGKGLHVVAPIRPKADWDKVKEFCHKVASGLAAEEPDRFVDNMSKAKRRGRVFIDYLRNQRGATSIAAFSTRARPGATVSMPVPWKDLPRLEPGQLTIQAMMKGRARTDPWVGFWKARQSLKA